MGSQNSEESEDHENTHIDLKEQRRLKRLDQLALARQKAAEVKKSFQYILFVTNISQA